MCNVAHSVFARSARFSPYGRKSSRQWANDIYRNKVHLENFPLGMPSILSTTGPNGPHERKFFNQANSAGIYWNCKPFPMLLFPLSNSDFQPMTTSILCNRLVDTTSAPIVASMCSRLLHPTRPKIHENPWSSLEAALSELVITLSSVPYMPYFPPLSIGMVCNAQLHVIVWQSPRNNVTSGCAIWSALENSLMLWHS